MKTVTIDFETYWTTEFSLSKISFMEYIQSPDFETISVSIKHGSGPTNTYFGRDVGPALRAIDWSSSACVAHNGNEFDFPLLVWKYGCHPKLFVDTLCLSRPKHQSEVGGSLKKLSTRYNLPEKDNAILLNTRGKRLSQFTPEERSAMARYNRIDTDNTYALFKIFTTPETHEEDLRTTVKKVNWAKKELLLSDMTARMICYPKFHCDTDLLQRTLTEAEKIKQEQLLKTVDFLNVLTVEEALTELQSAQKFADALRALGVAPPTKVSPRTGKETYAFAKTDEEFTKLLEHPDERVQIIVAARLGVKSTLLETRLATMMRCAEGMDGAMPVPLAYHSATTGRWGGRVWNPQNLPRIPRDKQGNIVPKLTNALRMSLIAPPGHKVVTSDLSGIELRVNHYLWAVSSTAALYAGDPQADLYKTFAAKMYAKQPQDVTKDERQLAKMCLAEGTLILTRKQESTSWVPIETFDPSMKLWDGQEWVWASGVVSNGWRQTQQLCGIWLTPDHRVLCGTTWQEAQFVRGELLAQALATGAAGLPSQDMWPGSVAGSRPSSSSATAGSPSTQWRPITTSLSRLRAATSALRKRLERSGTGSTSLRCRMMQRAADSLTGCRLLLTAAIRKLTPGMPTTADAAFGSAMSGALIAQHSLGTSGPSMGGRTPQMRWTASTATKGTNPETSGSSAEETTCSTSARYPSYSSESRTLKRRLPVYDILNCGPRNRFTVLTDSGPLVVHNCQLGLGFGAGAVTFQRVAKLMGGIDLDLEQSRSVTYAWRDTYVDIVNGWRKCQQAVEALYRGSYAEADPRGLVRVENNVVLLPSGRTLHYPDLEQTRDDAGKVQYVYGQGKNRSKIYGGLMCENLVQAIARDVIAEAALNIQVRTGYAPAHTVHDELVYVVPTAEAPGHLARINEIMRTPPAWLPGIVLWSEGDIADSYGESK